jgi:hypothetical protein
MLYPLQHGADVRCQTSASLEKGREGYEEDDPRAWRGDGGADVRHGSGQGCTGVLGLFYKRLSLSERAKPALVVWIDGHEQEYGRGLIDGFQAEDYGPEIGNVGTFW